MNLQNIDALINKNTEKQYYIESVTYCFPYDINHTFHGDYGPLSRYIGKSRAVSRDEIDQFICEMIMNHPFVSGSMRLDINIMCREQKGPVANVTSFYHSLSFKNDAYKEQQKGDMTIQYEKQLQKDFSMQQEDITKFDELNFNSKFTADQMYEIRKGLKKDLDVSIYADTKFDWLQMKQIRLGLEKYLDISIYADPQFNFRQMEQIRKGLKENLDVSIYANPEFDWQQMYEIRLGLEDGLDVSIYTNPEFDWIQMREIRLGLKEDLNQDLDYDDR